VPRCASNCASVRIRPVGDWDAPPRTVHIIECLFGQESGHRFELDEQFGQQALAIVVATFLDARLDNACDHGSDLRADIAKA
jgi:hypothetical protein